MSRKHERFKPKPRSETAVTLTKKSVAKSQLETAIWLWFQYPDPVSTLVLAFNAHEILHALGTKIGKPSKFYVWLDTIPRHLNPQRFRARWTYVWNFCKHGMKDIDDDVLHDPNHAEILINFATQCYVDLYEKPTPLLFAFGRRFLIEHPDFVDWIALFSDVSGVESIEAYWEARTQSRHEFLKTCLLWIDSKRPPFVAL